MKSLLLALFALCSLASAAFAGATITYQVTGVVAELTETKIVLMKGKEKWELARTPATYWMGPLTVGAKVTVQYSMTAQIVQLKEAPPVPGRGGHVSAPWPAKN